MGRRSYERKLKLREEKKKKRIAIGISVSACIVVLAIVVGAFWQSNKKDQESKVRLTADENGDLRIAKDGLHSGLNHVEYGGKEELIIWKDGGGVYRTVFDTCEECYPAGNVSFTMSGQSIICDVCENKQPVFVLGTKEWGGCKPVSVPPDIRGDTDAEVVIPAAVLAYAEDMFSHWDESDFSISFSTYGDQ